MNEEATRAWIQRAEDDLEDGLKEQKAVELAERMRAFGFKFGFKKA